MRVDKCPNCGAFLPAPAPGDTRVRCDYCHVEARTTTHVPVQRPLYIPPQRPPERPPRVGARVALAISLFIVVGIVGFLVTMHVLHPGWMPSSSTSSSASSQSTQKTTDRVDVLQGLAEATSRARGLASDAALLSLNAPFVRADGVSDLTLGTDTLMYQFRSPSRSRPAAERPIGSEVRVECNVFVAWMRTFQTVTMTGATVEQCQAPVVRPPTCTVPSLWERAWAAGAPRNAVARIDYKAVTADAFWRFHGEGLLYDSSKPVEGIWTINISDGGKTLFRKEFPDDCDGAPAAAPLPPSLAFRTAVDKLFPGDSTMGMWTCTLRAGVSRAHVKAHLVVPSGGSPAKVSNLVVTSSKAGARSRDELAACMSDRIATAQLPAPGAPTELDIEFDAAH